MGAFSADGILSSAFGIVNEKDDNFLRTVDANGECHFDVSGSGWTCDQYRVGRVLRRRECIGQVRDELAGAQNDEVDLGQERGLECFALVEEEYRPCVGDARRATRQTEFDFRIWFANGSKSFGEILRANVIHEDFRRSALAEELYQFFIQGYFRTQNNRPAERC